MSSMQPALECKNEAAVQAGQISISASAPSWYAAYTCSRHEKTVTRQLEDRRIECFLPLYHTVRRWKDRRKEIEVPLFPGYIFTRIPAQDRLRVLQIPGVVRFVSFGGNPAPLPEQEMEALRNGLHQRILAEPHPFLRLGRKVRVIGGPMAGAEGILVRKKDKYRVVISIEAIMRSVAVEVDASDVQPL